MWIDSHCHMDNVILNQNSEKIINECVNEGVNQIIIPSVSKENFDKVINLASKYKHCVYALGIHPMVYRMLNFKNAAELFYNRL